MTRSELADLAVDLVQQVSEARRAGDGWRVVAIASLRHAHALHVELERVRRAYHHLIDERRAERRDVAA